MTRILITGASGFLGSHIAEQAAARGARLRLLLRRGSNLQHLGPLDFERVEGDLRDEASLASAVRGVDAVIHAAGLTMSVGHPEREYVRVNTRASEALAGAAADAGVSRFVLVSSQAAQGPSIDGNTAGEQQPRPVSAYGRSKLAAEAAVLRHRQRMSVAVLRPSVVYGPRDRALVPLYKIARLGFLPALGDGGNVVSWVYAEDAAEAIVRAALTPAASGSVYTFSDGRQYTWRDLIEAFAAASGRRVRLLPTPPALYTLAGSAAGALATVLRRPLPLNPDQVRHMRARFWTCDNSRIEQELGWRPAVGLEEGMQRTLAWYREQGWL